MTRLRRSRPSEPGWTRRRAGRGWVYLDEDGTRVSAPEDVERVKALVIPPAWTDVWICPYPNGHLQAVGTDDAGRRQYLYHTDWRRRRDQAKHQRVLDVAARLPAARARVEEDLQRPGMPRERVLAVAFRLLDLGLFRVGGETYAEDNGSFGLATLHREHVRVGSDGMAFDYIAKSGKRRRLLLHDDDAAEVVRTLKRRRDGSEELLAWREQTPDGVRWTDVTSTDINAYVHAVVGADTTAKDFRTWHGTVLAARAFGAAGPPDGLSRTRRSRVIASVMREVSEYLGNTPTVARASYVDPRVVDLWEDGVTIAPVVDAIGADAAVADAPGERRPQTREALEAAVLDLLTLPPARAARVLRRRAQRTGARRGSAA